MTWVLVVILIITFTVVEPIVLIWALVHFLWKPLPDAFPAAVHGPDAVTRRFQSFRIGMMNLGYCIHVTVDENHLHLEPAAILRWFGAGPMSIPWDSISIQGRRGRWLTARIGKHTLRGPAWCLELAEPAAAAPDP